MCFLYLFTSEYSFKSCFVHMRDDFRTIREARRLFSWVIFSTVRWREPMFRDFGDKWVNSPGNKLHLPWEMARRRSNRALFSRIISACLADPKKPPVAIPTFLFDGIESALCLRATIACRRFWWMANSRSRSWRRVSFASTNFGANINVAWGGKEDKQGVCWPPMGATLSKRETLCNTTGYCCLLSTQLKFSVGI